MLYLFIGQDSPYKDLQLSSKDFKLKSIKEEFLPKEVAEFNFDTLYGDTLTLKGLQERLASLAVSSEKRIIFVRNAQELKSDLEDFIITWAKKDIKDVILLLDIEDQERKSDFLSSVNSSAKVFRFGQKILFSTFNLARLIEEGKSEFAVKALDQLIKSGERPERILGGLRYSVERSRLSLPEVRRRVRLLLECDLEIKTGRVRPVFALEKLVVKLSALSQAFH
jgi:DNA polymerase III delta subunit